MTQQPTKDEGQGPASPSNPLRAAEESTEQRLARWRKLRDHLRDKCLDEVPTEEPLIEPERVTRPGEPLVAHYNKVKQKSSGKKTFAETLTTVLAVVPVTRVLAGFEWWFDNPDQTVTLSWLILTLVLLAVTYTAVWVFLSKMGSRKDSMSLDWEGLSLSLPDGNRHATWPAVHSAIDIQRRMRFSRRKPYVRVELNDGVVARLYVDEIECRPLADLMTNFLLCARNSGETHAQLVQPLPQPAGALGEETGQ